MPVQHINQHLRPISLTPILSKVAQDFVVSKELKPAILKILDPNQFGVIAYVDHCIILEKLKSLDISNDTINWITDFLTNRKQRVKTWQWELQIDLKKTQNKFPPIQVHGKSLEVVEEAKLLGLTITSNLKWNKYINNIIFKSSKQIYLLVQLKHATVEYLTKISCSFIPPVGCIRPILEVCLDSVPLCPTEIPQWWNRTGSKASSSNRVPVCALQWHLNQKRTGNITR